MAARYVDPGNVVAQGQSFYTGLLPGSYEKGAGGGGGSNVYGKGSGGSAGVSADRTSSEAGVKSIKDYKPGGSIFIPQRSDSDRLDQIAKNTAPGGPGGGQVVGQGVAALLGEGKPQGPNPFGQNPMGSKASKAAGTAVGLGVQGVVTAKTGKPILGKMAGATASKVTEHGVEKMGDKLGESPIGRAVQQGPTDYIKDSTMGQWGGAVQRRASTRAQTRQAGVQQSATHKSFLYPNMANSTNRALNF